MNPAAKRHPTLPPLIHPSWPSQTSKFAFQQHTKICDTQIAQNGIKNRRKTYSQVGGDGEMWALRAG